MKRYLAPHLGLTLVLLGGCGLTGPDEPFIQGTITSRSPLLQGSLTPGRTIDSLPAIFVDASPTQGPGSCQQQARLHISARTLVRVERGRFPSVPVDTGVLQVGRRVTVWVHGAFTLSCPPMAHADEVRVTF